MMPRPLNFWGFNVYGSIQYKQDLGTVLVFDAAPDKHCSAKGLFDLCYRFSCHRVHLEDPELTLEDKADYMCLIMADSCKMAKEAVSCQTVVDFLADSRKSCENALVTAELLWMLHLFWGIPGSERLWAFLDRLIFYDFNPAPSDIKPHMRPSLNI